MFSSLTIFRTAANPPISIEEPLTTRLAWSVTCARFIAISAAPSCCLCSRAVAARGLRSAGHGGAKPKRHRLKSGAVREGPGVALLSPIQGPGICGRTFRSKVAVLGEWSRLATPMRSVRRAWCRSPRATRAAPNYQRIANLSTNARPIRLLAPRRRTRRPMSPSTRAARQPQPHRSMIRIAIAGRRARPPQRARRCRSDQPALPWLPQPSRPWHRPRRSPVRSFRRSIVG